ncbi:MAG: exonuclease SbcCD subunit D [Thiothrix sp.]|nr:exonuclease SbcCD subunit D [Thiothrix sp.]HPQ94199.1 exonuclease SbcCD subunit D [Thiolinea sp.]
MKFLHTSDWHIGRLFHHASLLEDQRHVLRQIIQHAVHEQVDAVLLAGDVYDRAIPPVEAIRLVDEVLHELTAVHGIPVLLIAGNHDSPERLGFGARQLSHGQLHILNHQPEQPSARVLEDSHGPVAFYGLPYADPVTVRDRYDAPVHSHDEAMAFLCRRLHADSVAAGFERTVLLAHCFAGGSRVSDSERPLSVGGSEQVSVRHFDTFSYVALGHLHNPQTCGRPQVRYSGSILKYSFSETHQPKSVTLVEMDAAGQCAIRLLPLQPLHEVRVLEGLLADLLVPAATDAARQDYLLARLADTGALLDPMNRLRAVHPNILALERTGLLQPAPFEAGKARRLDQNELRLFQDFYHHLCQEPLPAPQQHLIETLLKELAHEAEA